jgi:hypothetical protein
MPVTQLPSTAALVSVSFFVIGAFFINLHRNGVTMIDLTEEELLSDLENA